MKVLMLGPERKEMVDFISSCGDDVVNTEKSIDEFLLKEQNINFIISYGYRYILGEEITETYKDRAINLHISLLPWNRGSDPNLWSFLEDTPKGVTIHYINSKLDKGDILVQRELQFSANDTLRTSYKKLSDCMVNLFCNYWVDIKNGRIKKKPQADGGSYHKSTDKNKYEHLLTNGWDTPVYFLLGKAKKINGA